MLGANSYAALMLDLDYHFSPELGISASMV
jgi:hypothetical protein